SCIFVLRVVFVLGCCLPPSSTLFPYTTLFRSVCVHWGFVLMAMHLGLHWNMVMGRIRKAAHVKENSRARRTVFRITGALIAVWGDRKSTRLNSSHVSISYAVFCLKKKKKEKEP